MVYYHLGYMYSFLTHLLQYVNQPMVYSRLGYMYSSLTHLLQYHLGYIYSSLTHTCYSISIDPCCITI